MLDEKARSKTKRQTKRLVLSAHKHAERPDCNLFKSRKGASEESTRVEVNTIPSTHIDCYFFCPLEESKTPSLSYSLTLSPTHLLALHPLFGVREKDKQKGFSAVTTVRKIGAKIYTSLEPTRPWSQHHPTTTYHQTELAKTH